MGKNNIFIISFLCLFLNSCNGFLDLEPLTTLSPSTFWKTENDLRLALNILYQNMNISRLDDNKTADTFANGSNDISSGTYVVPNTDNIWNNSYKMIRITNDFLENCNKAIVNDEIKKRYEGEAHFFRAYYYYKLVKRFGDVLLITKTLDMEDKELTSSRVDKSQIWELIISDLKYASENIPPQSRMKADRGRITQGAAQAMLARAALYAGTYYKFHEGKDFENYLRIAVEAAKKVIDSKEYSLHPSYRELFFQAYENSKEHILSYKYSEELGTINPVPRSIIYDLDCEPTKYLADAFLCKDGLPLNQSKYTPQYLPLGSEFNNRDPRMSLTLWKPGDLFEGKPFVPSLSNQTGTGYMFKKYGIESAFTFDPNVVYVDNILIRYAEVLLTYAEAKFELESKISDEELDMSINKLRDRFNNSENKLPHLTNEFISINNLDMRQEIRRERRVELAGEGFRYDDIIRWKTAEKELNREILGAKFDQEAYPKLKPGKDIILNEDGFLIIQNKQSRNFDPNKDYLYPIPLREMSLNHNITQNKGWE